MYYYKKGLYTVILIFVAFGHALAQQKSTETNDYPFIGKWEQEDTEVFEDGAQLSTYNTIVINAYEKLATIGSDLPQHGKIIAGYTSSVGLNRVTAWGIRKVTANGNKAEIEIFSINTYDTYSAKLVFDPVSRAITMSEITFKHNETPEDEQDQLIRYPDITPSEGVYRFISRSTDDN